ncbi:hypothetical protein [uncultured Mediterranean phage uvMED]|nr:hypothetical protein [uncultured Mediterranean phage uvMED]
MDESIEVVGSNRTIDYKRKLKRSEKEFITKFNNYMEKPTQKNMEEFSSILEDPSKLLEIHSKVRDEKAKRDVCIMQKGVKAFGNGFEVFKEEQTIEYLSDFKSRKGGSSIFSDSYYLSKEYRSDLIAAIKNEPVNWNIDFIDSKKVFPNPFEMNWDS